MKAKHFVTLFFVVGLVFAIIGIAGLSIAQGPNDMDEQESESAAVAAEPHLSSAVVPPGVRIESPPDILLQELPEEADAIINALPSPLPDLRIVGSALRPRTSGISYSVGGGGGCTYVTAGDTWTVWNAPVYLPQGAEVRYMRMYYDDTSASNCYGWFTVYDLYGNIVDEWSVQSSGTGGTGYNITADINHTINYNTYSYVVNWRPLDTGSDMQLCGFRIFYYPPTEINAGKLTLYTW